MPPGCGPARLTPRPAAPWAGGGRGGLDSIESPRLVRRGSSERARSATTLGGPPSARVPGQGGDLEGHRRGAPVPSWSGSAGLRVAFYPVIHRGRDPRRWSAPTTGCRTVRPASPWARGMDGARARGLEDLDPRGRGGGLLEGRRVCAGPANRGVQDVLIVEGAPPLESEARGGMRRAGRPARGRPGRSWPDSMVPRPRGPPRSAPPVRFVAHKGPQGGRRRRAPEPAPPPTRRPPDGPRAPSASPTRAREHPRTAAGAGEGLGEEHRLPGLPPGRAPGHLCTTNAVRIAQPPSRAVRREARPLSPPTRRRPELLWPAGLQHPRGRRAAQRAKDEEHARPLAQGQRVDSSTGRVTTNRSTQPAHPARLAAAYPDRINPHL